MAIRGYLILSSLSPVWLTLSHSSLTCKKHTNSEIGRLIRSCSSELLMTSLCDQIPNFISVNLVRCWKVIIQTPWGIGIGNKSVTVRSRVLVPPSKVDINFYGMSLASFSPISDRRTQVKWFQSPPRIPLMALIYLTWVSRSEKVPFGPALKMIYYLFSELTHGGGI